jgi:hypothetical protein
VELNNQAKHSVSNQMLPGQYRTHLIFDYLDDSYTFNPPRIHIRNGEAVFQTRRSIDTEEEVRNYVVHQSQPRFIIIGAQKCGTTSLYEYICQHSLVAKGKRRETHYFDWRFNDKLDADDVEGHRKFYLQFYEQKLLQQHPSICTGESTPSYLLHSDFVLPRLMKYVPWAKLLVMLRNPVDRAYSQFNMISDISGSPEQLAMRGHSQYVSMSFSEVVDKELEEIVSKGITANSSYEDFQRLLLQPRQSYKHGGHSILIRGMYALQLEAYLERWPKEQLKVLCMEEELKKDRLQRTMDEVFAFLDMPPDQIVDNEVKNSRSYVPMDSAVRDRLKDFYRPYNERLFTLLGRVLPWDK